MLRKFCSYFEKSTCISHLIHPGSFKSQETKNYIINVNKCLERCHKSTKINKRGIKPGSIPWWRSPSQFSEATWCSRWVCTARWFEKLLPETPSSPPTGRWRTQDKHKAFKKDSPVVLTLRFVEWDNSVKTFITDVSFRWNREQQQWF